MSKKVKVDGRIIVVPDDATPDEIDQISRQSSPAPTLQPAPQVTGGDLLHGVPGAIGDVATGAWKGLNNTAYNLIDLTNKGLQKLPSSHIPGTDIALSGKALGGIGPKPQALEPEGGMQKAGYTGEQIGEWLLPTGAEEKGAALAGKLAPKIAKYASPAAKVATAGIETGARNASQGGSFKTGAELGAAGAMASPIVRKAAQGLAEIAVAPGKRLLKSIPEDVDIGKTVLENSTGVRPRTIAKQLGDQVAEHSTALEDALGEAGKAGKKIPLGPARKVVSDEIPEAVMKNAPNYIRDVDKVADQLNTQYGPTGEAIGRIADSVSPKRARDLRQGVDLTIGSWNPEAQSAIKPLQKRVYGAITGKIHEVVPEAATHDAAMTNLIPAQKAAWNTAFDPGVARNVFNRIARPTGALAGGIAGGYEGYKRGGAEGAVLGSTIGLTVPELVTSPTGQMIVARGITNPVVGRFIKGAALNALPNDEQPAQ